MEKVFQQLVLVRVMELFNKYKNWLLAALAVLVVPYYLYSSYFFFWVWNNIGNADTMLEMFQMLEFQHTIYWGSWKAFWIVVATLTVVAITWEVSQRKLKNA